jgi:hypothetical protein
MFSSYESSFNTESRRPLAAIIALQILFRDLRRTQLLPVSFFPAIRTTDQSHVLSRTLTDMRGKGQKIQARSLDDQKHVYPPKKNVYPGDDLPDVGSLRPNITRIFDPCP